MLSLTVPVDFDVSSPLTYGTPSSRVDATPRSGARGTPVRQRADLGSVRKARQVDLHSDMVGILCSKPTPLFTWKSLMH